MMAWYLSCFEDTYPTHTHVVKFLSVVAGKTAARLEAEQKRRVFETAQ